MLAADSFMGCPCSRHLPAQALSISACHHTLAGSRAVPQYRQAQLCGTDGVALDTHCLAANLPDLVVSSLQCCKERQGILGRDAGTDVRRVIHRSASRRKLCQELTSTPGGSRWAPPEGSQQRTVVLLSHLEHPQACSTYFMPSLPLLGCTLAHLTDSHALNAVQIQRTLNLQHKNERTLL